MSPLLKGGGKEETIGRTEKEGKGTSRGTEEERKRRAGKEKEWRTREKGRPLLTISKYYKGITRKKTIDNQTKLLS